MKWDQNNPEKVKDFIAKMKQDYAFKKAYAARRAWEFYNHPDVAGMCYVAVGGLDSITLFLFLRSIGIDVPGTSVSMLEDRSIQKVHKALGIRALRPANGPKDRPYTKIEVIKEHGFPVLSKEIAGKISLLQHPSEKNATVRHAIMTGETGAYGGYRKNTRMKMSQKWLEKFGGPKGIGVLYCRQGVQLDPLLYGGGQERGRRPGTENVPAIAGMAAAMRTACENMEDSANTVRGLRNRLLQRIGEIQGNRIYGSMEARLPGNINCSFAGIEGETMVLMLDLAGVCVSAGSACTSGSGEPSHVLTAMGLSRRDAHGAIRITLGEENTAQEVDYIAATIENIVADLRKEAPANG